MERLERDPKGPRRGQELERMTLWQRETGHEGTRSRMGVTPIPSLGPHQRHSKKNLLEGQSSSIGKGETLRGSSSRDPSRAKQDRLGTDRGGTETRDLIC